MGLESDLSAGSADGSAIGFVDIFGSSFGRDVEPTLVSIILMYSTFHAPLNLASDLCGNPPCC